MTRSIPISVGLFAALALSGCGDKSASSGPPLPAVTVSKPLQDKVTEWDEYTGRFVAVATVEVRARVSGFIDSIHFNDGQIVKQSDSMFVIHPRPSPPTRDQAQADPSPTHAQPG